MGDCPLLKENEELKEEIKNLEKSHAENIEKIRQMLIDRGNKNEIQKNQGL